MLNPLHNPCAQCADTGLDPFVDIRLACSTRMRAYKALLRTNVRKKYTAASVIEEFGLSLPEPSEMRSGSPVGGWVAGSVGAWAGGARWVGGDALRGWRCARGARWVGGWVGGGLGWVCWGIRGRSD